MNVGDLVTAAKIGSSRATGRLLSLIENGGREEVLAAVGPSSARVVGLTGPPGAGKSTTAAAITAMYRRRGQRVAVIAVDPTSPYSGGALLGDRVRMTAHINDPDVLIRSVATRGHLGGLAAAVPAAIRLLAGLAYDIVLLETVGVGQSEIEVAAVADIVVVNKADRDEADQTVRDLRAEIRAPILKLVAARGGGVADLVAAIDAHQRADTSARRTARARTQILSLAHTRLQAHPHLAGLAESVAGGRTDAYAAVDRLITLPADSP
jgi:LAO/AO transport system kinase